MYKGILGSMLFFMLSVTGYAAGTGIYTISKVGCAGIDGTCWLIPTVPVSSTINNCTSGYEMRFKLSKPGGSAVLSLAMTAYTTGKKLEIYT